MQKKQFLEIYNRYVAQFDFDANLVEEKILNYDCLCLRIENEDLVFYFDDKKSFYILNAKNKYGKMEMYGEFDNSNCLELLIYLFDFINE